MRGANINITVLDNGGETEHQTTCVTLFVLFFFFLDI